jgi:hypothetical protein
LRTGRQRRNTRLNSRLYSSRLKNLRMKPRTRRSKPGTGKKWLVNLKRIRIAFNPDLLMLMPNPSKPQQWSLSPRVSLKICKA